MIKACYVIVVLFLLHMDGKLCLDLEVVFCQQDNYFVSYVKEKGYK